MSETLGNTKNEKQWKDCNRHNLKKKNFEIWWMVEWLIEVTWITLMGWSFDQRDIEYVDSKNLF